MVKIIQYKKKHFCQVKVGQFNGKFNSNQFSLLNFQVMSSDSKDKVDFVFSWLELRSELGTIFLFFF